jgi:hypothetical protein
MNGNGNGKNRGGLFGRLMLAVIISAIGTAFLGLFWGGLMFLILILMSFRDSGYIALAVVCVGMQAHAGELLNESFYKALHHVETSCQLGPILGDGGKALGPLQIHKSYWQDSGVAGKYEDCADLNYAIKVVTAYMKRYAPDAYKNRNYEVLARIHNGGPQGHKKEATKAYWLKVKKVMEELRGWGYLPVILPPYMENGKMVVIIGGYPVTDYVLEGSVNGSDWYVIDTINSSNQAYSVFSLTPKSNEMLRASWKDYGQFDDEFWYPI